VNKVIRSIELISVEGAGGGAESVVLRTAALADKSKLKMTLCCLRRADDEKFNLDRLAADRGIDYQEVIAKSPFDSQVLPNIRKIVRHCQADIIHAHGYKPAFFAYRIARSEGIKPLSTLHGWCGYSFRERFIYYPGEKMIVRTFPKVIAVSSKIRDTIIRWGCRPDNVEIVLNGIDADAFHANPAVRTAMRKKLGIADDCVVIGGVGRLERVKRFDILLETLKHLLPCNPKIELYIVGEGTLKDSLAKQINHLGLADRCHLLGYRSDIRDLYQAFDVLVQSSDSEGTPTVVVEAMALRVPVVATDVGGTHELAEHEKHALLVPRGNPQALAAAIEKTLNEKDATAKRVAAARRRVENQLSFQRRMRQIENIYEALAGSNDHPIKRVPLMSLRG
jgi:glycosyltransferase involved in cell wall biosynthesis